MYIEDQIAKAVRNKTMTIDEALELFRTDQVYVYPLAPRTPDMQWGEIEDRVGSAPLFHALTMAGATPEQLDAIEAEMERLREAGITTNSLHGTP